jgi:hypothetical protein
MADGDIILLDNHKFSVKLLDAHSATGAGPWVEVPPQYSIWSFHTTGGNTDTVTIEVSNAIATPSSTTSGGVLYFTQGSYAYTPTMIATTGATASIGAVVSCAYRWVRAVKAGTAGSVSVILEADSNQ